MDKKFTHLHLHTTCSLLDGAMLPKKAIDKARDSGYDRIALTEHGTMVNMAEYIEYGHENGVQVIPGCETYLSLNHSAKVKDKDHDERFHFVVLARNLNGYKNLLKLVTYGCCEGFYKKPRIDLEALKKYGDDLICLTACIGGPLNQIILKAWDGVTLHKDQVDHEALDATIKTFKNILGDRFYVEVQRNRHSVQELCNEILIEIAERNNVKIVATCDSHYLDKEDFETHQIVMSMSTNSRIFAMKDGQPEKMETHHYLTTMNDEGRSYITSRLYPEGLPPKVAYRTAKFYRQLVRRNSKERTKVKKAQEREETYKPKLYRNTLKRLDAMVTDSMRREISTKIIQENTDYLRGDITLEEVNLSRANPARFGSNNKNDFWLKTPEEAYEVWPDHPEYVEEAWKIAESCEPVTPKDIGIGEMFFPKFDTGDITEGQMLRELSLQGLQDLLPDKSTEKEYLDRLDYELNLIDKLGFSGYFLVVSDFVCWSKENGIPVGPGRGSGAGSLVACCMRITTLDPIEYGLFFERFLNPDRVSPPDFDIDFHDTKRDLVIDYVINKYGEDKVCRIATFGELKAKSAFRRVAKVLGLAYSEEDRYAKMIPDDIRGQAVYLQEIIGDDDESLKELNAAYKNDPVLRKVVDAAIRCEKLFSNSSTHAAGILIAPTVLTDYVPLYVNDLGQTVSQYDKDISEKVGLIKFDFLGLKNLRVIDDAVSIIKESTGETIDVEKIDMTDPFIFRHIFGAGDLTGVFQMEGSTGFKELSMRCQPNSILQVADVNAMYRPGPLDNKMHEAYIDDKIDGKRHKLFTISNPTISKEVQELLDLSHGVLIYQETIIKLVQIVAGYTLAKADIVRRIIGKKKPKAMAKLEPEFVEDCIKTGLTKEEATNIFEVLSKFCMYGFNLSHAAAYSVISYQTAWLKYYYPKQFLAACLSSVMHDKDKTGKLRIDCDTKSYKVIRPTVNRSNEIYTYDSKADEIVCGLGVIKDVGAASQHLIKDRSERGTFKTIFDFCEKVGLGKVNTKTIGALVKAGAFDDMSYTRSQMLYSVNEAAEMGKWNAKGTNYYWVPPMDEFDKSEMLAMEKEYTGSYLTGDPLDDFSTALGELTSIAFIAEEVKAESSTMVDSLVTIGGKIENVHLHTTKKGGKEMCFIKMSDKYGNIDVTVLPSVFEKLKHTIMGNQFVAVTGILETNEFNFGSEKLIKPAIVLGAYGKPVPNTAYTVIPLPRDSIPTYSISMEYDRLHELIEPLQRLEVGDTEEEDICKMEINILASDGKTVTTTRMIKPPDQETHFRLNALASMTLKETA